MSNKGKPNPHRGHPISEETRKKISEAEKGKHMSEESKQKDREAHKGKSLSEEHKRKISESLKGNSRSKGKHLKPFTKEHKRKIGEAQKGLKHWNWQGGISHEPYSFAFTKELKEAIRQRDNFICVVCGKYPAFSVHHIDYDKKNCEPDNLITLCPNCHAKTNFNRKYWINYFKNFKGGNNE